MPPEIYFVGASTNWRVPVRPMTVWSVAGTPEAKNPTNSFVGVCQAGRLTITRLLLAGLVAFAPLLLFREEAVF